MGAKFEMSTYFYSNVIWLESGYKMSPLVVHALVLQIAQIGTYLTLEVREGIHIFFCNRMQHLKR